LTVNSFFQDNEFMGSSWLFSSLLVVIPSILIAIFSLWVVRKIVPAKSLKKHHDVAGFTFSIVGVLYSVILGLTVVSVQERYKTAEEMIHAEATMLADLSRDAGAFPLSNQNDIRNHLRAYIAYVVQEEWGKSEIHLKAEPILQNIWDSYYSIDLEDDKAKIWYGLSISKLNKLMEARLAREYNSWQSLGGMMQFLLVGGAVITACFMFFFGLESFRTQILMMTLLVGYLSFMLFVVFTLDNVFTSPEGVKAIAFERVLPLIR